jgi:hypothetical protein
VTLLGGIVIQGNKESDMGDVHLRATQEFNTRGVRRYPCYDFIRIQIDGGQEQLGQLLALLEVSNGSRMKYFAIVVYLEPEVTDKNFETTRSDSTFMKNSSVPTTLKHAFPFFRRYQFEKKPCGKIGERFIDVIEYAAILGPAFVVPDFSNKSKISLNDHRFNHIPQYFFDRSGWRETESEIEQYRLEISVTNTEIYLNSALTAWYSAALADRNAKKDSGRRNTKKAAGGKKLKFDIDLQQENWDEDSSSSADDHGVYSDSEQDDDERAPPGGLWDC